MKTIFRFDLQEAAMQTIEMPKGAQILHIARQTRFPLRLSLWALVDPDAPPVERQIQLVGTGHGEVPDEGATFIATYQEASGYVWHFFDRGEVQ